MLVDKEKGGIKVAGLVSSASINVHAEAERYSRFRLIIHASLQMVSGVECSILMSYGLDG